MVNDWERGVTAPQNVVLISIPSVLDPSLAPPGKHVIHAYTPGSEPYSLWQGMDRKSEEYARQKQERAAVMWQALKRIIPDIDRRCEVTLVPTVPPLLRGKAYFLVQLHQFQDYYVAVIQPFLALAYPPSPPVVRSQPTPSRHYLSICNYCEKFSE